VRRADGMQDVHRAAVARYPGAWLRRSGSRGQAARWFLTAPRVTHPLYGWLALGARVTTPRAWVRRQKVETFTIYAEDGEYSEQAPSIEQALAQFRQRRPGAFVSAVVNDGMRPRLVIEDA